MMEEYLELEEKLGECKIKPTFGTSYNLVIERIKKRYGVNDWEALILLKQFLEKANMREQTRKFIEQGEKRRGAKVMV